MRVSMLSRDREAHEGRLRHASPSMLEMARTLQRAAFSGDEARMAELSGEFVPSPLYLRQAYALRLVPSLWRAMQDAWR